MEESSRHDIRRLLKTFGIQADEAVIAHLARNPGVGPLRLRLVLEDLTDYAASPPAEALHVELEGQVRPAL
jgi:hypothetical protein